MNEAIGFTGNEMKSKPNVVAKLSRNQYTAVQFRN